jgi:Domain of unknown function (DUF222)/HNH endonuclease
METVPASAPDVTFVSTGALLDALAAHEREGARLAVMVRGLERDGAWALDGSVSVAAWLREHARMSAHDAAALVKRGRLLHRYDCIARAAISGLLSTGQVEAVRRACPPRLEPVMDELQGELVDAVAGLCVADTETACALWKARAEALVEGVAPKVAERGLSMSPTADGMVGRFVLDSHGAAQVEQAVRTATVWDGAEDRRTAAESAADALVEIAAFFNANHDEPGTPRHKPHIALSVDESTLAERPEAISASGMLIDPAAVDTLLCDSEVRHVLRAHGSPVGLGRARHTCGKDLFAFVASRDGGCRFPGCRRPVRFTEAHHIVYWRHGGPTDPANLVLLCSRHHHIVHQQSLQLRLAANGELHVAWPNGRQRISQPRGAPPSLRRTRPAHRLPA